MKRLVLGCFIFIVSICSKFGFCDSPCTPDIFIDSLRLDTLQIKNICQIYPEKFLSDEENSFFEKNCLMFESEVGFVSLLDTTVAVFIYWEKTNFWITLRRNNQQCSEVYPNDSTFGIPGTHKFSEVLEFELTRLQKLGIIKNNFEEFETYINKWITEKIKSNKKCPGDIDWATTGIGPGCCSLVESSDAIHISQTHKSDRFFAHKLTKNVFRIEGVPENSAYRLFDMNGKRLQAGNLSGNRVELPPLPVILEIEKRAVLVKSGQGII